MTTYSYCVQCTDKTTGKTGDFLFKNDNRFVAISPLFNSVDLLFNWMKDNGYKTCHYVGNQYVPFGAENINVPKELEIGPL